MNSKKPSEVPLSGNPRTPTVSNAYARLLDDYVRAREHAPPFTTKAPVVEVPGNHSRPARTDWLERLAVIEKNYKDPDLALKIGESLQIRHLGIGGYVLLGCSSLAEAERQFARYTRLTGDLGGSDIRRHGDIVEDTFRWTEPGPPPPMLELIWASATVTLSRWLTGRLDLSWDAHFRLGQPANIEAYKRIFRGKLHFEAPATKLVFPSWVLDLPIATGNPDLRALAEAQAATALQELDGDDELSMKTRKLVAERLPLGRASVEEIAPLLGMSDRTLHRRLAESGTTFRALADAVRRERAETYLRNPAISLVQISFMLGYSEQSTFQHAFKRWTGLTPSEYRSGLSEK